MTQTPQPVKAEAPKSVQGKRLWEQEAEKNSSPKSPKPSASTPPGKGHNSLAGDQLKSILQRLERLDEDRRAVGDDIKEVLLEAKGNGFDPAIIKAVLKIKNTDRTKLSERNSLIIMYCNAAGVPDPFS